MDTLSHQSWFRDAIVYQILVDRFAGYDEKADCKKPVFAGGNLKGITDKIDYLCDLGINTLWISPINKTSAYHGYHVTDYFSIDKHFGTDNDLKKLIETAHNKNIRILLDFVPNHCSNKHPYFIEASLNKRSRFYKWFYFNRFNNSYRCFLNFHELPKINLDYYEAGNHLIEAARHWISMGIDGFRLDHAVGPSHNFWKAFRKEIKSANHNTVLIGEAWLEGIGLNQLKTIGINNKYLRWLFKFKPWDIQREYIGEFDGVLDFYFRHCITEFIAFKDAPQRYRKKLEQQIGQHYQRFPENYYLPSFIDNHDMNRFLFEAGQNREKLKQALSIQFSLPQPPILYYGTEIGLTHYDPVKWDIPFSDLMARQPMPWNSLDYEMIDYCKKLIQQRKHH